MRYVEASHHELAHLSAEELDILPASIVSIGIALE